LYLICIFAHVVKIFYLSTQIYYIGAKP